MRTGDKCFIELEGENMNRISKRKISQQATNIVATRTHTTQQRVTFMVAK